MDESNSFGGYPHPDKKKKGDEKDEEEKKEKKEKNERNEKNKKKSNKMMTSKIATPSLQQRLISEAVDKYFPTFESTSGWRLHSEYESIPIGLHEELSRFFRPYNDLLSDLLLSDMFVSEWSDRERAVSNTSYSHDVSPGGHGGYG